MLPRLHRFLTGRSKPDSNPILIALLCSVGLLVLLGGLSWLGPKTALLDDRFTLWLVGGGSMTLVFYFLFKQADLLNRLEKERLGTEALHDALGNANGIIFAQASARPMAAGRELWARRKDGSEFLADGGPIAERVTRGYTGIFMTIKADRHQRPTRNHRLSSPWSGREK
ncbi:MAG: hypothetical protein HY282_00050 [Nitrospirae bacterium]|nr:hypothetical protein [Candidatus Manganitrophaceae bacterium]